MSLDVGRQKLDRRFDACRHVVGTHYVGRARQVLWIGAVVWPSHCAVRRTHVAYDLGGARCVICIVAVFVIITCRYDRQNKSID